jgi:gallate decarboxylase subunit D
MSTSINKGTGRTQISLEHFEMGADIVVRIFNQYAHIGAVAIAEYDAKHQRASVSVVTRLGHKDDAIAQKAAYLICKSTQKTVCVIAGVHLDDISIEEITTFQKNADSLIEDLINGLRPIPTV